MCCIFHPDVSIVRPDLGKENIGLAVGEVVAITGCRSDQTSADVGNVHVTWDQEIAGESAEAKSWGNLGEMVIFT